MAPNSRLMAALAHENDPMKRGCKLPRPSLVRSVYSRAIRDESRVLQLWPHAREHKKQVVSDLALSPIAAEWLKQSGAKQPPKLQEQATIRIAHRNVVSEKMPKLVGYRPSELVIANLHEAWMPYAKLLLHTARLLDWEDFAELKPQLENLGFEKGILNLFLPAQRRRYFMRQTPASVATMIVARQRQPEMIGSEETLRTAQKRIYSSVRRRLKAQK